MDHRQDTCATSSRERAPRHFSLALQLTASHGSGRLAMNRPKYPPQSEQSKSLQAKEKRSSYRKLPAGMWAPGPPIYPEGTPMTQEEVDALPEDGYRYERYFILDNEAHTLELYTLGADGRYGDPEMWRG